MAAPQVEPIVIPLGLITQPNKLGQYPAGALSQALGVVMRSPGLLTKAPLLSSFNANPFITTSPTTPHLLLAVDAGGFWQVSRRNADSHWELTNFNVATKFGNDLNAAGLPYQPITFATDGRLNYTRSKDRYLFNSSQGILIVDTTSAGTNAAALPRMAGLPPPWISTSFTTTNGGAIASGFHSSSVAIIRRKQADGYEILSPPSAPSELTQQGLANFIHTVRWQTVAQVISGDVIEVYRTKQQLDANSMGAVYFRSATHVITVAEAAAVVVTIADATPDANLGLELYTNPGQTGALSAKYAPGAATCMATFKGYTFYGNRTDASQIVLTVPGGISIIGGATGYQRLVGIGRRNFTATFTNTTNTLTAISAADIVGLAVGQVITDAALTGGVGTITVVGAASVTLSTTANATVTKVTGCNDVIELSGTSYQVSTFNTVNALGFTPFVPSVAASPANDFYIAASELLTAPLIASPKDFAIGRARFGGGSFTIRASNGQNYVPALPDMSSTAQTVTTTSVPNGIAWSEQQQPEAVPPVNTAFVGSGTIYGMWPTRDALWIFASDGLWRLTGTGGAAGRGFDWRVDPVDSTLSLAAPHAACVLRDTVYAYTNRGLVAISNAGVDDTLSTGKINDLLPGPPFAAVTTIQIAGNETEDEIWLGIGMGTGSMLYYVYNTLTRVWTNTRGGLGNLTDVIQAYSRANQAMASIDTGASYLQSASQFEGCTVDYQPITTKDPFAMKQWLDATIVAASADAGKAVTPRFNGVAFNVRNLTSQNQDARTSWNVPRLAPAIANSLAPGFSNNLSSGLSIYGFSLRSVMLTSQRKQR
jgi:acyl dehydratase